MVLALTLFMPGINADYVDSASPANHFAIFANPTYTRSDFHFILSPKRYVATCIIV